MPRLSITVVNAKTQSLLDKFSFSVEDVWDGTVDAVKLQYINEHRNENIPELLKSIKNDLVLKYEELK